MPQVEIRVLGRFAVQVEATEVTPTAFGGRLPRKLVRILVARRPHTVSRDVLTDALWPRRPPADPAANISVLVNRARTAIGVPDIITTTPNGYALTADEHCTVDAERFMARAATAREQLPGNPRAGLAGLQAALSDWGGEPLAGDVYEDWAQPYRQLVGRSQQHALEDAAVASAAVGEDEAGIEFAHRAVASAPLRERAHLTLVRALAHAGDRTGALQAWESMRARLAEELGVDPCTEARRLHLRLMREPGTLGGVADRVAAPTPFTDLPLLGRGDLVAALRARLDAPGPSVVVLVGAAGLGKTRLLAEVVSQVAHPTIAARAFLPEREEPWALTRSLLREAVALDIDAAAAVPDRCVGPLADLLPDLADYREVPSAPLAADTRRALAREGALRLVEAAVGDGAVIVVDDLQWADASTLELLVAAVSRLPTLRLVVAHRPEEIDPSGPVARTLADLAGMAQVHSLPLTPLTVEDLAPAIGDPTLAATVADQTRGAPFAVVEVLRALAQEGRIARGAAGRWVPRTDDSAQAARRVARAGRRRMVGTRTAAQPALARQVLGLLALLGRETAVEVLATAADEDAGLILEHLDTLARVGLARLGEHGWACAHDLIAETTVEILGREQRGRGHRQLGHALRVHGADTAEIATHLAGAGDPAAATAYAQAAAARLARLATDEAGRLADAGLAADPSDEVRAGLLETRAEVRARTGQLGWARADLRAAHHLRGPGRHAARLLARLAMLASGADDLVHAGEVAELALVEAGRDPAARARALAVATIIDMNTGRSERARQRAEEALALFEAAGDTHGVADILDGRAMATFLDGDIRGGTEAFARAARLFEDVGDMHRVITPRSTRGHGLVFLGEPTAGREATDEALDLATQLGHPEGRAYALWHGSEALTALQRPDEALDAAHEALAIAQRIDHRGWTATALRAIGIAHQALGEHAAAHDAFTRSLEASAHVPLFTSWAHARLALVAIETGRLDTAREHVDAALGVGPPLGHYEARLAAAELAVRTEDPQAVRIIATARTRASDGGHELSRARLDELAARVEG